MISLSKVIEKKTDTFAFVQTLEYVCEEYGGRVELAKAYYKGLTKSLQKNFNGTGIISSMQHCNDFFFLGTWQTAIGRAGESSTTSPLDGFSRTDFSSIYLKTSISFIVHR